MDRFRKWESASNGANLSLNTSKGEGSYPVVVLLFPQGAWMGINIALFIYQFNLFQSSERFFYMRLRTRVCTAIGQLCYLHVHQREPLHKSGHIFFVSGSL